MSRAEFEKLTKDGKVFGRLAVHYDMHDNPINYMVWTDKTQSKLHSKSLTSLEVMMALHGLKLVHVEFGGHNGAKSFPPPKCCYAVEI